MNTRKRFMAAVATASLLGGSWVSLSPASAEPGPGLLGDVNGDAAVTLADAVVIHKHLAESGAPLSSYMQHFADVNGDGVITVEDARLIKSYYLGKTETFAFTHRGLTPLSNAVDTGSTYTIDFPVLVNAQADKKIRVLDAGGAEVESFPATDSRVKVSGARVTLTLDGLAAETTYQVVIDRGAFVDAQGNAYAGILAANPWRFTTAPAEEPVHDSNIYVAPVATSGDGTEDSPFGTMQEALDAVAENGTIHVKAGTYFVAQTLVMDKAGVKLQGVPNANGAAPYIMFSANTPSEAISLEADNLTLESIYVVSMHKMASPLVVVKGDNAVITDTIMGGPLQSGPRSTWINNSGIIVADHAKNVWIKNNIFILLHRGVQALTDTTGLMENNIISDTAAGVYIDGSTITITNNKWDSVNKGNDVDIILGEATTVGPPYASVTELSQANHNANISDLRSPIPS
ncbi:dockerin type I domain-containing protein [Paenibacillus nanensis]|nr:dockerin type I domain-containing protein [Paenibacillus nanensis]